MRYHYLNHDINPSSQCYGLFDDDKIVGFCAVTHFPHPKNPKIKHCHRLVILPDYQGIGLGTKFLEKIAEMYTKDGYTFSIITSARNLMQALKNRNDKWRCAGYGKQVKFSKKSTISALNKTSSYERTTASFEFRS